VHESSPPGASALPNTLPQKLTFSARQFPSPAGVIAALMLFVALASPTGALGAPAPRQGPRISPSPGTLAQLAGPRGCLVDRSAPTARCGTARALKGPGPFTGSRAIAISPDGRNVYVASSRSDAIAIFTRNPRTGSLSQVAGTRGCVAAKGADGCARAIGLHGPNSVAISPDGRNLYATSRGSNSVTVFLRNPSTGALRQLPGTEGCVSGLPTPGCSSGRALLGPDVVVISPDGRNVYVGSFFGNAVAVFDRAEPDGALTQPAGAAGCIAEGATGGCAGGIALGAPEGMAISRNGTSLYVASALSNALVVLVRDPSTGALAQATDGSGCVVDSPLSGCAPGVQLSGANAVAVSPGKGNVYATSLLSDSVTSFGRAGSGAGLAQLPGTSGCLVYLRAVGCSFGRALVAPEGLAVSPDGANVYAAAFGSGAIAVLDRSRRSGALAQVPGRAGCLAPHALPGCSPGHALRGAGSIALSPDGRNVYATAFGSNAVDVFRRNE
jgi:DNA-binding beta-propeller fold protein YncE